MPRKVMIYIAGLVVLAGALLWHSMSRSSGSGESGLGCYSAVLSIPGIPESGRRLTPADCGQPHDWEVISLLRADAAERRCQEKADAFLGGSWRASRVVYALLSATDRMRGGLFCALAETSDTAGTTIGSTATLKDGMRDGRLAVTCLLTDLEDRDTLRYGGCDEHHAAEAAGLLPEGADQEADCPAAAAGYLSLTVDELSQRGDLQVRWFEGERGLCLLVEPDDPAGRHDTLRASVKGLGRAPLPR
ncbi:hypothetical protein AB0H83_10385 [Dactylosporangium sp. NPDC050688]|uniref:hypothetical protein n=1 Tax=Dactylosporangium sp. NPDC050688 TaxID=3157217 RepID=UPI0033F47114